MLNTIWGFIGNNWMYFTIGAVVVVLLLLVIIILAVRHSKKKRMSKQKQAAESKQQNAENQQTSKTPSQAETATKNADNLLKEDAEKANLDEKGNKSINLDLLLDLLKKKNKEESLYQNEILKYGLSAGESAQQPEDDRVEKLRKLLLSRQMELEQEKKEIETLKNLNQELDDDGEEQRKAEQLELLMQLVNQREEEQKTLLKEIAQDKELAKEISDRNYLNALNEILSPKPQPVENVQPQTMVTPPKEEVELDLDDEIDDEDDDEEENYSDVKIVSKNAVVLDNLKKLTLKEAYEQLTAKQRQYFNKLRDYADKKPNAKAKETVRYVTVGCGNKNYIKLSIKKKTVIASFVLESEEMQRLRLSKKSDIKPEETKIKVVDDESFATAKQMIDIRVAQVAKEKEIVKELRKTKQKEYVNLKKQKNGTKKS